MSTNDRGPEGRRQSCQNCCLTHLDLKVTIRKHHSTLLNLLEPRYGLLETLVRLDVLTEEQFEKISRRKTTTDTNRALLRCLETADAHQVLGFRKALQETRQRHIVHLLDVDGNITPGCPIRPLGSSELTRMKQNHLKLVELIDTSEILERLVADECLNEFQCNAIQQKKTTLKRNALFLDVIKRRSFTDFLSLIHWLCETRQKHVARLLTEDMATVSVSVKTRPLSESELSQIKHNHHKVLELMDVTELLDLLAAKDLVSPRQRELIKSIMSSAGQNEKLLDIFKIRSFADFERFIKCLARTRQEHVAKLLLHDNTLDGTIPKTLHKSVNDTWKTIKSFLFGSMKTRPTKPNLELVGGPVKNTWQREILELLLIKTAYIFTVSLWKTTPSPDPEVFMVLASVCYEWYDAITSRRWFERTLASRLSKFCSPFRRRIPAPARLDTDGGRVTGVVEMNNHIYVTYDESNVICVYTAHRPYTLTDSVSIADMKSPWDLAACTTTGHLYVFDWSSNKCVWQIKFDLGQLTQQDENNNSKEKQRTYTATKWGNFAGRPSSLSVTPTGNVLIMDTLDASSCGDKLNVLSLLKYGMEWPEHVIETPQGTYIICHGTTPIQPHHYRVRHYQSEDLTTVWKPTWQWSRYFVQSSPSGSYN